MRETIGETESDRQRQTTPTLTLTQTEEQERERERETTTTTTCDRQDIERERERDDDDDDDVRQTRQRPCLGTRERRTEARMCVERQVCRKTGRRHTAKQDKTGPHIQREREDVTHELSERQKA